MKALVVLSGGQDSATALFWAKQHFCAGHGDDLAAVTFDYGQRHVLEVESAVKVAKMAEVGHFEIIKLGAGILAGTSGLVDPTQPIGQYASPEALPGGVEPTFIPARNALFLTVAANRAAKHKTTVLVTGVCEADFGGYPDCRQAFIDQQSKALSEAIYGKPDVFTIHTPLMRLSKTDTVHLAETLPGCMEALAHTHTCYNGTFPPCLQCHACLLRARGFDKAGVPDPMIMRAKAEGKLAADACSDFGFLPSPKTRPRKEPRNE